MRHISGGEEFCPHGGLLPILGERSTRLEGKVVRTTHRLCPPPPSPKHPWHLPPAAVGGDTFGPTSSVAVSEHGHGHHLVTQYFQGAQLLGESQCQLAGEASCVIRSLCNRWLDLYLGPPGRWGVGGPAEQVVCQTHE